MIFPNYLQALSEPTDEVPFEIPKLRDDHSFMHIDGGGTG
jgi:hypothetical protein